MESSKLFKETLKTKKTFMTTATLFYQGDLTLRCVHEKSGTEIYSDAPVDNKGKGAYFSPTDMLATSLAGCILITLGIRAEQRGLDIGHPRADVTKVMQSNPRRIAEVAIEIFFDRNFSEEEKAFIKDTAEKCPVAYSLHPDVVQRVIIHYETRA
jgi:uncharacterized OsmC-like protein